MYKGKQPNGLWFEGSLSKKGDKHYLTHEKSNNTREIVGETLRKFAGLSKDGKTKFYEGDIVKKPNKDALGVIHALQVEGNKFCVKWDKGQIVSDLLNDDGTASLELFGNILDNPKTLIDNPEYEEGEYTGFLLYYNEPIRIGDIIRYGADNVFDLDLGQDEGEIEIFYKVVCENRKLLLRDVSYWYLEEPKKTTAPDILLYTWISNDHNYSKANVVHKTILEFGMCGNRLTVICNDQVFHEDFFPLQKIDDYTEVMSLSQITKTLKETNICNGEIITVIYEGYMEGEIFQWGNYNKSIKWCSKGQIQGFA